MDELKHGYNTKNLNAAKTLDEIIYPEIEPGIISTAMIEKSYLEDGYKGEQAHLHQMEPIVFDRITLLRLDFRNILRIDHLWMLPNLTKLVLCCNKIEVIENIEMLTNLKELDLSFNYITKIQNLEKLVNLEVLSLFHNEISAIENLDTLEKLIILSIGRNKITTVQGIERFRFLQHLSVLNLEGNPVTEQLGFSMHDFVAAVLPNVKYYEYVAITESDRIRGQETYARQLREIELNEEAELQKRIQEAKMAADAERLSSSFVEHLNENQLYESLWKGDEDGRVLMLVGGPLEDLLEEYSKEFYAVTQEIYKLGLEKYEERQAEIDEFMSNIEEGHLELQKMGQNLLEEFIGYKDKIVDRVTHYHRNLEIRSRNVDEDDPEIAKISDKLITITLEFDDSFNHVWQQLMNQELHLHETTEETTTHFQRRLQEMIAKFVEQAQTHFGQLRDLAIHFSENVFEIVSQFIGTALALQDFDSLPAELRHCVEDRDALSNIVAGMKDCQTQRIDEREDRLIQRSKDFIANMIDQLVNDELKRHRDKILEICTFFDLLTVQFQNIPHEVREQLMNEDM